MPVPDVLPAGHGYASCCETCDDANPRWQIVRIGDVATTWACGPHLAIACDRLQRDWEVTRLEVTDFRKRKEWVAISRSLNRIAADGGQR